ncbi:MAG: hypothetical protein ACI90R_001503, partial [Alteromonas macleodii]
KRSKQLLDTIDARSIDEVSAYTCPMSFYSAEGIVEQ